MGLLSLRLQHVIAIEANRNISKMEHKQKRTRGSKMHFLVSQIHKPFKRKGRMYCNKSETHEALTFATPYTSQYVLLFKSLAHADAPG